MKFVRHCIVTEEFSGLNMSGGIGVCSNGLANLLINAGYSVDVLITDLSRSAANTQLSKKAVGPSSFVFLSDLVSVDRIVASPVDAITKAFSVYRFLRNQDYSTLHFNDWMGSGFFCAMARRQGLLKSQIVTHLHGSSEWVRRGNLNFAEIEDYEREGIERSQIENSDVVISPSAYLLDHYRNTGITLPEAKQLNWLLPEWISSPRGLEESFLMTRAIAPRSVSELIFFGRQERRKGFELFVDAVARLPRGLQPDLAFFGRFDRVGHEFSGSHVFRRLPGYPGRIRFLDHMDREEAMSRIAHAPTALCVTPSLIENSPCVIGECFTVGAPFLTTDVGGTAELIDPDSRPYCVVRPEPSAMAQAIERAMAEGVPALRSTIAPKRLLQTWVDCVKSLNVAFASEPEGSPPPPRPLVSVCVTHYERPHLLSIAIDALLAQTYDNIEIVIVDDGSTRPDAHAFLDFLEAQPRRFPIKIIRSTNRYLGAARNLGASFAKGEYLLFHDDDNFMKPNGIEVFVEAAVHSGCDILTSQFWMFRSEDGNFTPTYKKIELFPIGIGGVFSFFRNRFGDANALFKRSVFESLGGFTEHQGVGLEDWELFLRAFFRDAKMGIVPEPLFNYRVSSFGMLASSSVRHNFERLFAMVDEERPRLNADLLRYAQRHAVQQQAFDQLLSDLEKCPASELHRELAVLEPGSPQARAKLSDLAFALGRVADGLEIGIMDFQQREKMLMLASHLSRPCALTLREKTFVTPSLDEGAPAVALRGWAFVGEGQAIVPQMLAVNGVVFQAVAHTSCRRPDVVRQHNLAIDELVGFMLVATRRDATWRDLARRVARGLRIDTSTNYRIELINSTDHSFRAFIDDVAWCCEVKVQSPQQNSSISRIAVESIRPEHVFLKDSTGVYVAGDRVSSTIVKFDYSPDSSVSTFILPREGKTNIIFESLEYD